MMLDSLPSPRSFAGRRVGINLHVGEVMVATTIACFVLLLGACGAPAVQQAAVADTARIRKELEALYRRNAEAFLDHNVAAVMALRAADFHTVTPDGRNQ